MDVLERWCRTVAAGYTEHDTGLPRSHVEKFWSRRPIVEETPGRPALGLFPFKHPIAKAAAPMKFVNGCPLFLVGDALQEPYWPKGEGIGKGLLGVLDAVHSACLWGQGKSENDIVEWRQSLFRQQQKAPRGMRNATLTAEEGAVPGFTSANYKFTVDPKTRYIDCS